MRIWSKLCWVLAWFAEAIFGLFFPLLLLISAVSYPVDGGLLVKTVPGFWIVLILLDVAVISTLAAMILHLRRHRKWGWILLAVGTVAFAAAAIGIRICCIPASGAQSISSTGGYKLTTAKLLLRHWTALLVPLFVSLAVILLDRAEGKKLFEETLADVKKDGSSTLSMKHERDRREK